MNKLRQILLNLFSETTPSTIGDWVHKLRAKRAALPRPHVPEDKQP